MKKRVYLILMLFSLLLLVGCKDPIYEDEIEISGDTANMEFTLDSSASTYDVELRVKYSYRLRSRQDKVVAEIVSPTGQKYSDWAIIKKKAESSGSSSAILQYNGVAQEEGTYKVSIIKESKISKVELKKATLRVFNTE